MRCGGYVKTTAGCLLVLAAVTSVAGQKIPGVPMPVRFEDSARYRWMHKPVLEARLLDDMEDLAPWSRKATFGYAVPVPPHAEMTLSTEYFKSGEHAIRFRSRTDYGKPGPQMGRPFGSESIVRNFDGEDWSAYNRLSFWVRPEIPGFHVVSLLTSLHNDGKIELPGKAGVTPGLARLGLNFLILNNHAWNHVVWEIPDLPRDKVTGIEFQYRLQGHEPGAADQVTYYFDRLELERVNADYFEGWNVAPGRIAYSHSGYQAGASKTAIASGLDAGYFQVIDQATGETALKKSVSREKTNLGEFLVLNFSELRRPGEYLLRVGDMVSQPFRIGPDIWTDTIWKSMNYFFCQRCGYSVPGIHGVCHRDWQGVHGDRRIIINGGWHDAGDTCQGLANTGEAVYAMFSLAERLRLRGEHPELARRLVEEGRWGLEWILKTSFGDGFRIVWATHDFWTDGILDDFDDVTAPAVEDSGHNFVAASAEAIASRVYREEDSVFASYCLKSAQADWRSAVEGSGGGTRRFGPLQTASAGVLASVELFRVAGDRQYADEAVRLADVILSYQQRTYLRELDFPLAGFFWESPAKEFMLHESHLGDMQGPVLALTQLCEAFPAHPEWMRWYTGVVLYSEYLKAIARYTEPYGMLPESLYKGDEYLRLPEKPKDVLGYRMPTQQDFREQVLNGIKVGSRYYLRLFPVWFERRGNHGILLPKAKALAVAAHLRSDLACAQLAERQLEWAVGRNPFSQSTMTGEGYDFVPHYSAMSGNIVGSLPVGIETYRNHDIPYWPVHNHMNPKETWVRPVAQWISSVRDLGGAALVVGRTDPGADGPVRFREELTGDVSEVTPHISGSFRIPLPQGIYTVSRGGLHTRITLLPAAVYDLDFRSRAFFDFTLSHSTAGDNRIQVEATVHGTGMHSLSIRSDGVRFEQPSRKVEVGEGGSHTVRWTGVVESARAPWVVVVIPDGDVTHRKEITSLLR